MTIREAIEKAIEGGYVKEEWQKKAIITHFSILPCELFLDPLFWQSLGKAMGWSKDVEIVHTHVFDADIVREKTTGWQYEWHRFIDHLAENKDAESFFENL